MLPQTVAVETEIKAAHEKDFLFLTATAHLCSPNAFQSYLLPCNWLMNIVIYFFKLHLKTTAVVADQNSYLVSHHFFNTQNLHSFMLKSLNSSFTFRY